MGIIGSQAQTIVTSSKDISYTALLAKKFCERVESSEDEGWEKFHFSDGSTLIMTFTLDRAWERIYDSSRAFLS